MDPNPLVTVVTPSFNQGHFLEQTIQSVLRQDYQPIEYIVVDGGSTDDSLRILSNYSEHLTWVSEPDDGQADAINKGFRRATGEIFAWLNADDLYTPQAISTAVKLFRENPDTAFLYGDAAAIDEQNRAYGTRLHVHQTDAAELVNVRDYIVQPAAFWRASLWHAVGELDVALRYGLDYEYWMRAARQFDLRYIPVCLAQERIYPQTKTFSGSIDRYEELERIAVKHGGRGLPSGYHAEACACYLYDALGKLLTGRAGDARQRAAKAARLRPNAIKCLALFGSFLLFGTRSTARRTLWLNRFRSAFRLPNRARQ